MPKAPIKDEPAILKVAVLGMGASGIATVRALAEQPGVEVHGYEERKKPGGNVRSVKVPVKAKNPKGKDNTTCSVIMEGGAEFIGSKTNYPLIHRAFELAGEELTPFKLSIFLANLDKNITVC